MNSIPEGAIPIPTVAAFLPYAPGGIPAGFPSPAEDFDDEAEWRMRQELRTPRYTTRLEDIPIAVAG